MTKATGIGGVFLRADHPTTLALFARINDPVGNPIELCQPARPAVG